MSTYMVTTIESVSHYLLDINKYRRSNRLVAFTSVNESDFGLLPIDHNNIAALIYLNELIKIFHCVS